MTSTTLDSATIPASEHHRAIQSAVQKFDEVRLVGDFALGDATVTIERRVAIRGVTTWDRWRQHKATVHGGGALERHRFLGEMHSGAFKVASHAQPVLIENLAFTGWKGEAILVESCGGLTVQRCTFTHAVPGQATDIRPATPDESRPQGPDYLFVTAIFAAGGGCSGKLVARHNECRFEEYSAPLFAPDDEQFVTCLRTRFSLVDISKNRIEGHDEAIEVIGNFLGQADPDSRIVIDDNDPIRLTKLLGPYWGSHAGIVCCNNGNERTTIRGNVLHAEGNLIPFVLSGDRFTITGNTVNQAPVNGSSGKERADATFVLGCNISPVTATPESLAMIGLNDMGASFSESFIHDNAFAGETGIWILMTELGGLAPNESKDDKVWQDDLRNLSYGQSLVLGPHTSNNYVSECIHDWVDLGRSNHVVPQCVSDWTRRILGYVQYHPPWPPPWPPEYQTEGLVQTWTAGVRQLVGSLLLALERRGREAAERLGAAGAVRQLPRRV